MLVKFFIQFYKYIMHVDKRWSSSSHDSRHNNGQNHAWESEISQLAFIVCALMCAYILKRLIIVVSLVVLFRDHIFL